MIVEDLRGSRPFPLDKERKQRCKAVLDSNQMTITELAFHLGQPKSVISEIISGRRLTEKGETEIANFFNLPREAMFPLRTAEQIYYMRVAELEEKKSKEEKKQARMNVRTEALSKIGAA